MQVGNKTLGLMPNIPLIVHEKHILIMNPMEYGLQESTKQGLSEMRLGLFFAICMMPVGYIWCLGSNRVCGVCLPTNCYST